MPGTQRPSAHTWTTVARRFDNDIQVSKYEKMNGDRCAYSHKPPALLGAHGGVKFHDRERVQLDQHSLRSTPEGIIFLITPANKHKAEHESSRGTPCIIPRLTRPLSSASRFNEFVNAIN